MITHIVIWKLKQDLSAADKDAALAKIKHDLEALDGKIDGLLKITVNTELLSTSSADLMLYTEFESEAALAGYQTHELHLAAAVFVRSVIDNRLSSDYISE
jgi:hypothetical protein